MNGQVLGVSYQLPVLSGQLSEKYWTCSADNWQLTTDYF